MFIEQLCLIEQIQQTIFVQSLKQRHVYRKEKLEQFTEKFPKNAKTKHVERRHIRQFHRRNRKHINKPTENDNSSNNDNLTKQQTNRFSQAEQRVIKIY